MKPMPKLLKRLTPKRSGLTPLFACFLVLSSCSGFKPFPTDKLYGYDKKFNTCTEYEIVDMDNMKFEAVGEVTCPDIFGFTSRDMPKVLDWVRDTKKYAKDHCQ